MALQIPGITTGSGVRVDLGAYDDAFITGTSTVVSSDGTAIYGTGGSQDVIVAGYVAGAYGIYLGGAGKAQNSVRILDGGVVSGGLIAVRIEGAANTLVNAGSIDGSATGVSFHTDEGAFAMLSNSGRIWAVNAVEFVGGRAVIDNRGEIGATLGSAITGSTSFDELHNTGRIFGDITMRAGSDDVVNAGLIQGVLLLGSGDDTLVNRGMVDGDVNADDGDDIIVNRGTVTGVLQAGSGDDLVTNRGEVEDLILLEDGFDTFRPGAGIERADGGTAGDGNTGFDALDFSASNGVRVALDDSFDGTGWAAGDTYTGFETVYGSLRKADVIAGTDGGNYLDGQGGADRLYGRGGADTLVGGAGNDRLVGGAGSDFLTGGTGADRFVFGNRDAGGADLTTGDTISDFNPGESDRIDLAAIDANARVAGNQAFALIGQQAFHKVAGELRVDQSDGVHTVLQADLDGNGLADFWIVLNGKPTVTADALVL